MAPTHTHNSHFPSLSLSYPWLGLSTVSALGRRSKLLFSYESHHAGKHDTENQVMQEMIQSSFAAEIDGVKATNMDNTASINKILAAQMHLFSKHFTGSHTQLEAHIGNLVHFARYSPSVLVFSVIDVGLRWLACWS